MPPCPFNVDLFESLLSLLCNFLYIFLHKRPLRRLWISSPTTLETGAFEALITAGISSRCLLQYTDNGEQRMFDLCRFLSFSHIKPPLGPRRRWIRSKQLSHIMRRSCTYESPPPVSTDQHIDLAEFFAWKGVQSPTVHRAGSRTPPPPRNLTGKLFGRTAPRPHGWW